MVFEQAMPGFVAQRAKVGGRRTENAIILQIISRGVRETPQNPEEELSMSNEIVASLIRFYALRCKYCHSDIEKKKNPRELLKLLNNLLDKSDQSIRVNTNSHLPNFGRMSEWQ